MIAPVELHGRLWREQANRRQPTDGLNEGLNGVEQPTEGDLFLKRATAGWLAGAGVTSLKNANARTRAGGLLGRRTVLRA